MFYTNIEFYIFLPFILVGYWTFKGNSSRKIYLLAWSYYLYACWDYRFLLLILFQSVVDFFIGQQLEIRSNKVKRDFLLTASLLINLGLLSFFKYCNFFIESFSYLAGTESKTFQILLPLGISFYTFRSISYIMDIYWEKAPSCKNFFDYALFLSFFPILLAGPIVRAKNLLPQFDSLKHMTKLNLFYGFKIFTIGLFQKVFIADRLALYVNTVFDSVSVYDSITCWIAVLAYTLQIYCDFQGYSNMAIGVGKFFGYEIPVNFNWPYLASSINEFWRKWHITLSSWIQDYLYIPLGGNRKGILRTNLNLIFAMTLCGFWHGAGWTFIFWGFYHGLLLVVQRLNKTIFKIKFHSFISLCLTQFVIVIGWVFFRADTMKHGLKIIKKMFFITSGVSWFQPFVCFLLFGALLTHIIKRLYWPNKEILTVNSWYTPTVLFCLIWLVIVFRPEAFTPFVYAQF